MCNYSFCHLQIGTTLHEIGHTIGLIHEHLRPDRDGYLTIHYENMDSETARSLEKWSSEAATTNDIPYDHTSIMHYGRYVSDSALEKNITSPKWLCFLLCHVIVLLI